MVWHSCPLQRSYYGWCALIELFDSTGFLWYFSVLVCAIYNTVLLVICQKSLKIVLIWNIAGLGRKNNRGVDECKQTFFGGENSCLILHVSVGGEGRAGSRRTVSTNMFWWPHTYTHKPTHSHTPCQHSFSFWAWLRCEVTLNRKSFQSWITGRFVCCLLSCWICWYDWNVPH